MDALLRRHYMMTRLRPASQQVISYRATPSGTGAASIAKIKGRTNGWNQLYNYATTPVEILSGITVQNNNNGSFTVNGTATSTSVYGITCKAVVGHKYLVIGCPSDGSSSTYSIRVADSKGSDIGYETGSGFIFTYNFHPALIVVFIRVASGTSVSNKVFWPICIDLTLMYGSGKEPATTAAFLAEYPEALTAPYNAGKLVPNKVTALVTDGFNQWDEQWELGEYNSANGAKIASTSRIRSKNYIPCLPNTTYYIMLQDTTQSTKAAWVYFYGPGHKYISASQPIYHGIFTTPANCYYITFNTNSGYGTTYKNNIAINLSHSGIRNGEYEPYWQSTLNIDHSKIYGKLNGAGERVQIAHDGFRGVGANYDEVDIVRKEAYIRRAWVDMGTLNWQASSLGNGRFYAAISNIAQNDKTMRSPKYVTDSGEGFSMDKTITGYLGYVRVYDTAYASATPAEYKAAMDGVMLDYQLATPLHYTDLMYSEDGGQTFVEIPAGYRVDDFGTERRLPDGIVDGAPASTPLVADIRYPW